MWLAAPRRFGCAGQTQIRFVHDGRGVQRFIAAPTGAMLAGQPMQFVVNQGQQLIKGLAITIRQLLEELVNGARV